MNHYPNHPRFITVAEFDARGQYQNVNVAPLVATESTDTTAVYDVRANQTPVLVPHLAPLGKDWLWSADTQKWTLIDNYAVVSVYSKIRGEQCAPPEFGDELTNDMTLKTPPSEPEKITYWDAKADGWAMRDDLTGKQVFNTADPRQSLVLGREDWTIPDGYTDKPAPSLAHVWDKKTGDWVLDKAKQAEFDAQAAQVAGLARLAEIENAIQSHINQTVQGLGVGFTDDQSLIGKYAGYENVFRPYAEAIGKWVAEIWYKAGIDKAAIIAGEKPIPTIEEALAEIPTFVMPEVQNV